MKIPVKRAKSTALGKKPNSSRGPTIHRKGPFPEKAEKGLSTTENGCININQ